MVGGGTRGMTSVEDVEETSPVKRRMMMEKVMTEQEAMQEEVVTRLPGPVAFMLQYEWKPLTKIIIIAVALVAMYFIFGIEILASSAALFFIVLVFVYILQTKNMAQDFTYFFEVKKAGQLLEAGDHSPYKNSFIVQSDRVAMWTVPNGLIRRTLFKLPAAYEMAPFPVPGNVVFVDYFDEYNRTCAFPRTPDVANIAFEANMNPLLAKKFDEISNTTRHAEDVEARAVMLYHRRQITKRQMQEMLRTSTKERISAMYSPIAKRRDIIFDLQRTIPQYQDKIRYLQDNLYLLADEMATAGIYQLLKIPMPDKIRDDHNFIRQVYGLPLIRNPKQQMRGGAEVAGR
jgi:hypothetical protein